MLRKKPIWTTGFAGGGGGRGEGDGAVRGEGKGGGLKHPETEQHSNALPLFDPPSVPPPFDYRSDPGEDSRGPLLPYPPVA